MPQELITNAFVNDYQNKVYMALKEIGGKFSHTVGHETLVGEGVSLLEVIGNTQAYKKTKRYSDTPGPTDILHDKRWVFSDFWRAVDHLDTYDKVKMLIEVKDKYAGLQANALMVEQDTAIINALIGPASTGKGGKVITELPDQQKLFVDGTTQKPLVPQGLSTYKLRRARMRFKKNNVDLTKNKLYIIVDPQQLDDMLQEQVLGSIDYNSIKALIDGDVNKWMGFEFIEYNELPFDEDNNIRTCITYVQDAVTLAKWDSIKTKIDRLPLKDQLWQIYTSSIFGATRVDEKLVATIGCIETDLDY